MCACVCVFGTEHKRIQKKSVVTTTNFRQNPVQTLNVVEQPNQREAVDACASYLGLWRCCAQFRGIKVKLSLQRSTLMSLKCSKNE